MSVNFDGDSKKENFLHRFREKLRKIGSTVDEPAPTDSRRSRTSSMDAALDCPRSPKTTASSAAAALMMPKRPRP